MSPPIREGSGDSIGSIRLGDGSEISEVRTGAGDVLFSSGPDAVIDQFEGGGLISDSYNGTTSQFEITQASPVLEGQASLKANTNANRSIVSFPGDGLQNYPSRSDQIRGFVRAQSGADISGVVFFAESGTTFGNISGYLVSLNFAGKGAGEGVFLDTMKSDFGTEIDRQLTSLDENKWYQVDIFSEDPSVNDTIEVEVRDIAANSLEVTLQASNSDHNGKGFGFKKRNSGVFDDYRLDAGAGLP